MAETINGL